MSRQYGIQPQQLVGLLQQNNQLPAACTPTCDRRPRRGGVVEAATVTDTDGAVIDTMS